MKHTIRQGNHLWLDVTGKIELADSNWDNWSGKWNIADLQGTSVASGDMSKESPGFFGLSVPPATTALLEPGTYKLTHQERNDSISYLEESEPDILVIERQLQP